MLRVKTELHSGLVGERLSAAHMPSLDGVRGIAILWVMLYHFLPLGDGDSVVVNAVYELTGAGWLGVDLFFILSGFLITRILVTSRKHPGYFRNFYSRRFLRIFPLYYGVLAVVLLTPLMLPALRTPEFTSQIWSSQGWLWLYGMNWHHWWHGEWLFDAEWIELNHFWSLAVEEQFYLAWPLLLWALPPRAWIPVLASLVVSFNGIRLVNALYGSELPHFRMDGLIIGALLYLMLADLRYRGFIVDWGTRLFPWGVAAFVMFTFWREHGLRPSDRMVSVVGLPLFQCIMACGMVRALAAPEASRGYGVLNGRVLASLGRYSYGLYVYHVLLRPCLNPSSIQSFVLPEAIRGTVVGALLGAATLTAIAFLMAWVSYHAFEKRFLALKVRFR